MTALRLTRKKINGFPGILACLFIMVLLAQTLLAPMRPLPAMAFGGYTRLFAILTRQYPSFALGVGGSLAAARYRGAMQAIQRNKQTIEEAGERFGIPPQIIASVILKEQFTQSAPDALVVLLARLGLRKGSGSTGLGAVTAKTCRDAWNYYWEEGRRLPEKDADLLDKLAREEDFNIQTIAAVLGYEARRFGYGRKFDFAALTRAQWHRVYNKYNGDIVYADKTMEYVPLMAELFA